jgi:hypothetical protein
VTRDGVDLHYQSVLTVTELEMWRWGAVQCVLVLRDEPRDLVVQVKRGNRVLATSRCADPDGAAVEAERLYDAFTRDTTSRVV